MFDGPPELLQGPAAPPPFGATPHFATTSPEQKWFYLCAPLCTIIPGLLLILRFYTKIKIVRRTDLADYSILVSFILLLVVVTIGRITMNHGTGVHQWNLRLEVFMRQRFWLWIGEIVYGPAIFLVKFTIVLQYIELFAPVRTLDPFVYIGGWITILLMFLFYTAVFFTTLFMCTPREKIWNPLSPGKGCANNYSVIYSTAVINVVYDVVVMLLPVPSIWGLHISLRKKFGIIWLFATGLLATVATSMRVVYTQRINGRGAHVDSSYYMAWAGLWSLTEIALGIMIACLLSLLKFLSANSNELSKISYSISRRTSAVWSLLGFKRTKSKMSDNSTEIRHLRRMSEVRARSGLSAESDGESFALRDTTAASDRV